MDALNRREIVAAFLAPVVVRSLFAQGPRTAPAQPAKAGAARQSLLEDVVVANHILYMQGVVDAFGHVSVRTAPGAGRYLLSRSIAPATVTAGDIIEYDLDSKPAAGDTRSGYLERFIHGEIYRVRPEVMSVVHCHAPALIPFGVTGIPLRPIFHVSAFVGAGVPVFDIRAVAGDTDMLISSPELGKALASTLGDKPAVLMRGHGAVIVGTSIQEAVARSVYLEVNARVQAQAMASGAEVTYLSQGEVEKRRVDDVGNARAWDLWKREAATPAR